MTNLRSWLPRAAGAAALLLAMLPARADEVRLAGERRAFPCTVISLGEATLELAVSAEQVARLRMRVQAEDAFPDALRLRDGTREHPARLLVLEGGLLSLRLPRGDVAAVTIAPPAAGRSDGVSPAPKEQVPVPPPGSGRAAKAEEGARERPAVGSAEGRVLLGGSPAAGATLRAVRIGAPALLRWGGRPGGESFEAKADAGGSYRFEELPAGHYKLFVQLCGQDAWIRRLRDKPDFEVNGVERTLVPLLAIPTLVH